MQLASTSRVAAWSCSLRKSNIVRDHLQLPNGQAERHHVICLFVISLFMTALALQVRLAAQSASVRDQQNTHRIVMRPIPFGRMRQELTLSYIRSHYDAQATGICIEPLMIIIHWTASRSVESALQEFYPATVSPSRQQLRSAGKVNVSAHFLVDKDGSIYQLMPVTWMARHTIGLNPLSIGIENVGGGKQSLTKQQLGSDAWLIAHLKSEFESIHYLIGHNEYLRFRGTPLWRERDNSYFDSKPDPGEQFMQALRSKVADLRLAERFDGYGFSGSQKIQFSCK